VIEERSAGPVYRERVLPSVASIWSLVLVTPVAWLTFLPFVEKLGEFTGVGIGLFITIAVLVSIWFAAPVIEVDETGFAVGETLLPLSAIGGYEVVPKERAFVERGSNLDPGAYVRFQLSVNTLIKLQVVDPDDRTPYWLIATRRPEQIADCLVQLAKK